MPAAPETMKTQGWGEEWQLLEWRMGTGLVERPRSTAAGGGAARTPQGWKVPS